jgi:hypothetical protein
MSTNESDQGRSAYYSPSHSDINFAVPDISILGNFRPYGKDLGKRRDPGIYTDIMDDVSNALDGHSCCLSYDGKKIKQGLTPEF